MEATKVAVLGTGRMGGALARRLQASGFAVTVWDRTREKAERLKVGPVGATPADAIRGANVVLSSLTDAAAVRSVYLGRDGIIEHAAGQLLVEMSTGGPDVIEEIAQQARV
ncbi:MAG TPA: NAD(P)-binding domain-containing protein, partial [Candidatus Limnocylindria bacterium]|nr:NAD(P)-binding domain-containing protein [Candidatus Limnocylindria bacterium]